MLKMEDIDKIVTKCVEENSIQCIQEMISTYPTQKQEILNLASLVSVYKYRNELVTELLNLGADNYDELASSAANEKDYKILEILLTKNINNFSQLLEIAVDNKDTKLLYILLDYVDRMDNEEIPRETLNRIAVFAAKQGNRKLMDEMIKEGANNYTQIAIAALSKGKNIIFNHIIKSHSVDIVLILREIIDLGDLRKFKGIIENYKLTNIQLNDLTMYALSKSRSRFAMFLIQKYHLENISEYIKEAIKSDNVSFLRHYIKNIISNSNEYYDLAKKYESGSVLKFLKSLKLINKEQAKLTTVDDLNKLFRSFVIPTEVGSTSYKNTEISNLINAGRKRQRENEELQELNKELRKFKI